MRFGLGMGALCLGSMLAAQAAAQVTLYEGEQFSGASFRVDTTIPNFSPLGFNDRARSAWVEQGRWELCEDAGFRGRCTILGPGQYPTLAPLNLNRQISSARPLGGPSPYATSASPPGPAPYETAGPPPGPSTYPTAGSPPGPGYDYRPRPEEHLYEVPVHSVRVVVGPPAQHCWVERGQVVEPAPSGPNVPGALIGAVIGGVLGHQVGGGRGKDVATAGGAVAGAAIGSSVGRTQGPAYAQDVQRCETVPGSARPDYWDVLYYFDGQEHRVQLSAPPGPSIWVNRNGEPRM